MVINIKYMIELGGLWSYGKPGIGKYRMELAGLLMELWKDRNMKVHDGTGWAVNGTMEGQE